MEIKKSVRPIIENLIAQYLPVAAGIAVFALAWISRQLSVWEMVLLFFGLVVLVILAINQIYALKENIGRKLSSKSNEDIEATLQRWFLKHGWAVGEDTRPNMAFQFVAKNRQQNGVLVSKHKDLP